MSSTGKYYTDYETHSVKEEAEKLCIAQTLEHFNPAPLQFMTPTLQDNFKMPWDTKSVCLF